MRPKALMGWWRTALMAVVLALGATAFLFMRAIRSRPEGMSAGKFPEQLVYVRSQDDIINGGVIFTPPKDFAKSVAVIWIHGWGVNFYSPTYVGIGRSLAEHGYT